MMRKKLLIYLVVALLALFSACGQAEENEDRKSKDDREKDKTEETIDEALGEVIGEALESTIGEALSGVTADKAPEVAVEETIEETAVTGVFYEYVFDDSTYCESAVIKGMTAEGEVVWQYNTAGYEVAQVSRVEEIGLYNDMYYLVEGGTIKTLHFQTGEVIWENTELAGAGVAYDFDAQGNLYICGYFGPDLMIVDVEGNTLERCEQLDNDQHLWPYQVECTQDYVFITFEYYDAWKWEERPFWENGAPAPFGGYTLSYCLADGTIGTEHNVVEPSPGYHCFYQEPGTGELQIDYLGEETYLINFIIDGMTDGVGIIARTEGNALYFAEANENYAYEGLVYKYGGGIAVVFTHTTDSGITLEKDYLFGVEEVIAEENVEEELTSQELMARITQVSATSSLSEYDMTHVPEYVIDGDLKTGWVEGAEGQGIEEVLTITLSEESPVKGFYINAGYQKSESLYDKNSRPAEIRVVFSDGKSEWFPLEDVNGQQQCTFSETKKTTSISIVLSEVYPGSKYEDTVISEIVLY